MKILETIAKAIEQYAHNVEDYDLLTEFRRCQVNGDDIETRLTASDFVEMYLIGDDDPVYIQNMGSARFNQNRLRRVAFELLRLSDTMTE